VRREWLRTFLAAKTAPKGTVRYLIAAVAQGDYELTDAMQKGHQLAVDLLGINVKTSGRDASRQAVLDALTGTTDARAQVITLGLVLGAYEDSLGVHTWRSPGVSAPRRYLTALGGWGYELSDIERLVVGMPDDQDSAGQYKGGDDEP
jgi:ParB family chromosome partitioning protein